MSSRSLQLSPSSVDTIDATTRWGGGPVGRSASTVDKLSCELPQSVELRVLPLLDNRKRTAGGRLIVTLGATPKAVIVASFPKKGAPHLAYDARYCRAVLGA